MNFNSFDLNLLTVLNALLAEESVTRAAVKLRMTQPATSAALARIRRQLDDPILVREGRGLRPTPFGESLAEPVRDMLATLRLALEGAPAFNPSTDRQRFRVVASDYVALILIRPLIVQIQRSAPAVRVTVSQMTKHAQEQLLRDEVDLVIAPSDTTDFRHPIQPLPLFTDDFVCIVWSGNRLVKNAISMEQFSQLQHLGYSQQGTSGLAESQLLAMGVHRDERLTTQSFALTPFLLRGTDLLAVVQRRLAVELREAAELRIVETPFRFRPIEEIMAWHPRREEDPALVWFRDEVFKIAATMGAGPESERSSKGPE